MDARPDVVSRIGTFILTDTSHDELVCMRWSSRDVCVVPVQAALQLDGRNFSIVQRNRVVMPIGATGFDPFLNETTILHVIQDVLHEGLLFPHGRRDLTSDSLD